MKQILIIILVSTGVFFSCGGNKQSKTHKTFSSKKGNTLPYIPNANKASADSSYLAKKNSKVNCAVQPYSALDSSFGAHIPSIPVTSLEVDFHGSSGVGTGGSYASYYVRQENMKANSGRCPKNTNIVMSNKTVNKNIESDSIKSGYSDSLNVDDMDFKKRIDPDTMATDDEW